MSTITAPLRERVAEAANELDGAPALEIVRWAVEATGGNLAVAGSMQDSVTSHLVSQVRPGVDVLFLDTGYHFAETLRMRGRVQGQLDVTVIDVKPKQTVAEQDAEYGARLHDRDPGLCCFLRKVAPLAEALEPYDAWVTGLRRDESPTRAGTPVLSWDDKHDMLKVAPLATWTDDDVESYQVEHGLLRNALVLQGYASIGCQPCTRLVAPGEDARSGRWAGTDKVECGIHI
jgi:phosphoadenosine phosphosulfate reductase